MEIYTMVIIHYFKYVIDLLNQWNFTLKKTMDFLFCFWWDIPSGSDIYMTKQKAKNI